MSKAVKIWAQKSGLVGKNRRSADEAGSFYTSAPVDDEGSSRGGPNRLSKANGSALNPPLSRQEIQALEDRAHQNSQAYPSTQEINPAASDERAPLQDNDGQSRLPSPGGVYRGEDLPRAMDDFRRQLFKLKKEYPELALEFSAPFNLDQVSWAQRRLIEEFEGVTRTNYDLREELDAEKRASLSMAAEIKRVTEELKKSESLRTKLFNDYNKSKQILVEQKERAEKDLRKGLDDQLKSHSKAEKSLRKEYEESKKQIEKDAESKWKDHFKFQIDSLNQEVNDRKREIEHNKRVAQESERMLAKRKDAAYKKLELEKDTDFAFMVKQYEDEKSRTRQNHDAEVTSMRENHEAEMSKAVRELQQKVEDLKSAIVDQVKKDYFKSMGDGAISNQFQGINNSIDEFSRVPWESSLELSWPYPSQAFSISDNSRRTKQYIMQNTLWIILYERILCTPFRMLGMRGKDMEDQWIKQFQDWNSSGSLCPRPTPDSEKWRYETIKTCTEAINQKSPNDTKLEYEQSLRDTCDLMCQELEKITRVTSNDRQGMSELVKKAAKLWLEVGQQRYRVYVLMSESGKEPVRGSVPDHEGALSIVVTPGLRRFGNSQGDRLDKEETVMGCRGKFATEYIAK